MRPIFAALLAALPLAAHAETPNPCRDPAGFARHLVATNPGADYSVLAQALVMAQEHYGCRAPAPVAATPTYPTATRCAWEGVSPRQWVCRSD